MGSETLGGSHVEGKFSVVLIVDTNGVSYVDTNVLCVDTIKSCVDKNGVFMLIQIFYLDINPVFVHKNVFLDNSLCFFYENVVLSDPCVMLCLCPNACDNV